MSSVHRLASYLDAPQGSALRNYERSKSPVSFAFSALVRSSNNLSTLLMAGCWASGQAGAQGCFREFAVGLQSFQVLVRLLRREPRRTVR